MGKSPTPRAGAAPARSPARPAGGKGAAPRKAVVRRGGPVPAFRGGWAGRLLGGASWLGIALIVLAVLVILPIVAAVLGDVWAVILGALAGGFALGRATAR